MKKSELIQMPVNKETLNTLRDLIAQNDQHVGLYHMIAADVRRYLALPVSVKHLHPVTMAHIYEGIALVHLNGYVKDIVLLED